LLVLLILQVVACGTGPQPTTKPEPLITPTYTPLLLRSPTITLEPFVGGECDPATDRIEMNTSLVKSVDVIYTYPEAC
jgi:hypothetical protein